MSFDSYNFVNNHLRNVLMNEKYHNYGDMFVLIEVEAAKFLLIDPEKITSNIELSDEILSETLKTIKIFPELVGCLLKAVVDNGQESYMLQEMKEYGVSKFLPYLMKHQYCNSIMELAELLINGGATGYYDEDDEWVDADDDPKYKGYDKAIEKYSEEKQNFLMLAIVNACKF